MPDGRRIVFRSQDGSRVDIFRKPADRTGAVEALTSNGSGGEPLSISPDGKQLVYRTGIGLANNDLMLLPLDGSGGPTPLLADPKFNERNGEISPDGRWIAYDSDESGHAEVYVRPFPNVDAGRWAISSAEAPGRPGRDYDVASDGRVLVTRLLDKQTTLGGAIVVVSHWIGELDAREIERTSTGSCGARARNPGFH